MKTAISEGGLERLEKARREVRRAIQPRLTEISMLIRSSLKLPAEIGGESRRGLTLAADLFLQGFVAVADEMGYSREDRIGMVLDTFHQLFGHEGTYILCDECLEIRERLMYAENHKEEAR